MAIPKAGALVLIFALPLVGACSKEQPRPQVVTKAAPVCRETTRNSLPQLDGATLLFVRCGLSVGDADDAATRRAASDLFYALRADAESRGYRDVIVSAERGNERGALNVVFKRSANGEWAMVSK